ncbi:MAG: hypothetical protein MN733_38950, partial [Nitrososphaera sp.]|nr:hypothetical protein [Nitrososphaera sp.]
MGEETLSLLPPLTDWEARNAFLERLRDLGDEPTAKQVCEFLLSSEDFFQDLDSLSERTKSQIFSILADAHPQAGLRTLERVIAHLPHDRLLQFRQSRRNVIWTLEKLAWQPATFLGAARLLLQLAEAENEEGIVNNATGVWISLFGTRLGGTAVPAIERHQLLREALQSSSVKRQLLAVQAIERAVRVFEMGMPISNSTSEVPLPRWQPRSREEDREARRSALLLLDQAMTSTVSQVREAAIESFINSIRDLLVVGLVEDVLRRLPGLPVDTEIQKWHLRDKVEQVLEFEASKLQPEHQALFTSFQQTLAGQTFGERLRRWVGKWTLADNPRPRSKRQERPEAPEPEKMAANLAEEVIVSPELLAEELNWLSSEAAVNVFFFARRLGELDEEARFWNDIESLIQRPNGMLLASAYLRGHVDAGRRNWRDAVLNKWLEQEQLSPALLDAIWRTGPNDEDAYRLRAVIQKEWLDADKVSLLIYGGETKSFSSQAFHDLLESMVNSTSESAAHGALSLLDQRLDFHPNEVALLEPLAWKVLEAGIPPRSDTMGEHDWIEVARAYLSRDA